MILDLLIQNGEVTRDSFLTAVAFIIALITAMVLHEISHGYVAYFFGDDTAKLSGRLSLNPAKHVDLYGLLFMLFAGFGWAKPVPVNPNNFKNKNVGMLCVALAGITMNLIIAFVSSLFLVLIFNNQMYSVFNVEAEGHYVWFFLFTLMQMNVSLNVSFALFNLVPLFPLDGYRVVACFTGEDNNFMLMLRKYSLWIMLGLLIIDTVPYISNFSPLYWYINVCGDAIMNGFTSFWRLLIGG